jgi:CheY-like chemotaxis protein
MRILTVDVDPDLASTVSRVFGDEHEVVAVRSGFAALDLLAIGRAFDIVLCEVELPDMPGEEVHRRLVESAPRVAKKFVFVTGDAKAHKAFLSKIPNPYLEKPLVPSTLRQVVRDVGMR